MKNIFTILILTFVMMTLFLNCSSRSPSENIKSFSLHLGEKALELDADQQKKLDKIVESGLEAHKELVPINRELYDELESALRNKKFNEKNVKVLIQKRYEMQANMIQNELSKFNELLSSLTETQRSKSLNNLRKLRERSKILQYSIGDIQ